MNEPASTQDEAAQPKLPVKAKPRQRDSENKASRVAKQVAVSSASGDPLIEHTIRRQTLDDAWRQQTISQLLKVFYIINGCVLGFLFTVWLAQTVWPPQAPIITERSILALIAGSTAQLGALALFVGRALVPVGKTRE